MMNGGKLPPGSPLRDFMYSSAEPTLVCKFLSPRVLYKTVVSDSDGRNKEEKKTYLANLGDNRWLKRPLTCTAGRKIRIRKPTNTGSSDSGHVPCETAKSQTPTQKKRGTGFAKQPYCDRDFFGNGVRQQCRHR